MDLDVQARHLSRLALTYRRERILDRFGGVESGGQFSRVSAHLPGKLGRSGLAAFGRFPRGRSAVASILAGSGSFDWLD